MIVETTAQYLLQNDFTIMIVEMIAQLYFFYDCPILIGANDCAIMIEQSYFYGTCLHDL